VRKNYPVKKAVNYTGGCGFQHHTVKIWCVTVFEINS